MTQKKNVSYSRLGMRLDAVSARESKPRYQNFAGSPDAEPVGQPVRRPRSAFVPRTALISTHSQTEYRPPCKCELRDSQWQGKGERRAWVPYGAKTPIMSDLEILERCVKTYQQERARNMKRRADRQAITLQKVCVRMKSSVC
jgi:hypothetical protein